MAYDKAFFNLLRKDRDDAARARVFDEVYPDMREDEKAWCDRALFNLTQGGRRGLQQAKSLIIVTILFYHMKTDEQDRWREHGEYVRAAFDWAFAGKLSREVDEEISGLVLG